MKCLEISQDVQHDIRACLRDSAICSCDEPYDLVPVYDSVALVKVIRPRAFTGCGGAFDARSFLVQMLAAHAEPHTIFRSGLQVV